MRADNSDRRDVILDPGNPEPLAVLLSRPDAETVSRIGRWMHRYLRMTRQPATLVVRRALLAVTDLDIPSIAAVDGFNPKVHTDLTGVLGAIFSKADPISSGGPPDGFKASAPPTHLIRQAVRTDPQASTLSEAALILRLRAHALSQLVHAGMMDDATRFTIKTASFFIRVRRGTYRGTQRLMSYSWIAYIGHIVMLAHLAYGARHGLTEGGPLKVWAGAPGNAHLLALVRDQIAPVDLVEANVGLAEHHLSLTPELVDGTFLNHFDAYERILSHRPPDQDTLLTPTAEHRSAVTALLTANGLPADRAFVTVHIREGDTAKNHSGTLRNSDVLDLMPAIRALCARGLTVVRLGDPRMTPLPQMEGVLDYAHTPSKSEMLDVALAALARFHIGSSSGMSLVPMLFGVPTLFLQWYPIHLIPYGQRNRVVLKGFVDRNTGHPLATAAHYRRLGGITDLDVLADMGARLENLTSRHLTKAVLDFADAVGNGLIDAPITGNPMVLAPSGPDTLVELDRTAIKIL